MPFLLLNQYTPLEACGNKTDDSVAMSGQINKSELVSKLQTLEGLTDEERSNLIGLLCQHKKYGLLWEEKPEEVEERLREELPVLVEDSALRIDNSADAPTHILIEGDNLKALTTLSYTHEGKVDVIYIDPPYNTGNKDFVYNDSFVDSEDSYRHSKWLSFMSKRLRIAKRLLSDRGVIFISIDDNEQANLKLLCDEVFGERNFVAQLIWERAYSPKNDAKYVSNSHDYVLMYAKFIDNFKIGRLPRTEEANARYKNPDNDPRGVWKPSDMSVKTYNAECDYPITTPSGRVVKPPAGRCWSLSRNSFLERLHDGRIYFGDDGNSVPCIKRFLAELKYDGMAPTSLLFYKEVGHSQEGAKELKDIIETPFDGPKPVRLIYRLLQLSNCGSSSSVLDFFAGSGTTMHAVMQLNKEDGGKRQCILVTKNENNICREVTYERNCRVIEGYTTPKGTHVEGLKHNNLRYYRTHLLPRERTNRNMRRLVAASTDLLCIKESLWDEFQVSGSKFQARDVRLFSDGNRAMMVIYNEELIPEVVDWLQTASATQAFKYSSNQAIKVYVFSPGAYAWDDDFAPVIDKVELCALPEAIYQAYKSVLPKKK